MTVKILEGVSHTDHNLSPEQLAWVMAQVQSRESFFIETFQLPDELGTVPCGLHGPATGGGPVSETEVRYAVRNNRDGETRFCDREPVQVHSVTAIGGEKDGEMILYTAYGGPCAPREPFDPSIQESEELLTESRSFWAQHALSE